MYSPKAAALFVCVVFLTACTKPAPEPSTTGEPVAPPVVDYSHEHLPGALHEAAVESAPSNEIDFAAHEDFLNVSARSGDQILSATGRPDGGWNAAPPLIVDVTIPDTFEHSHVFSIEVVDGGVEGTFQTAEVSMLETATGEWHVPADVKTSNWKEEQPDGKKVTVHAFKYDHEHPRRVRITIPNGTVYSPQQVHLETVRVLGTHD